ncbi:hypothetical protein ACFVFS_11460 [Kitasatospora sp. NPDC057692]|uniref:hypothetical protein n=1 Tax=Kitasatospora sp. NPDC057692 TaxID=3346215 RepID=UPI0036D050DA
MNARITDARPPNRPRPPKAVARALIPALLILAGLAATVLGFTWFAGADLRVYGYRSAPPCSAKADQPATGCVRIETGTVTAKAVHAGAGPAAGDPAASLTVTVAREAAPTRSYKVGAAFHQDVEIGTTVDLTIFRGRVAALTYQGHRADNPNASFPVLLGVALLVGLGSATASHGLSWPRLGPAAARFAAVGALAVVFAFFGCFALVWLPLTPVLLLALPAFLWLTATAAFTVATWND